MTKFLKNRWFLLPVLLVFAYYLAWLFRAYYDVAYMDQIQILAGNINHMYSHQTSLGDFYYRPPFLLCISTLITYLNCKLFAYNTFYETIASGLILFLIAYYFIGSNISFFTTRRSKFYFSLFASLIIFSLAKWEMSLWGTGFSHYMVVFFAFICVNMAHKYYMADTGSRSGQRYFIPLYVGLSVIANLETTSYFLPFQVSLLILLFVNFKIFREKIDLRKWKIVLITTLALTIFSFLINYLAERYSISHPYDAYGKVNVSQSIGQSFKKIFTDPAFVAKFFLTSNAGNVIDNDSYQASSFWKTSMPFWGLLVLLLYGYAIFVYIKKRKIEGLFSINLILGTIIFCATVVLGRLGFNDVYYGASSRYSAATFSGLLGLTTFFLLLLYETKGVNGLQRIFYNAVVGFVVIATLIINRNQWRIAPYRKDNLAKMAQNLKTDQHLESLLGYNNEITEKARVFLMRNKLNIFRPKIKLDSFRVSCSQLDESSWGFYNVENDQFGELRWTNGNAGIILPNLYTSRDTVKVILKCYSPQSDTPRVVLNNSLTPFRAEAVNGGFEYFFAFHGRNVFLNLAIQNRSIVPHMLNKENPDERTLGLIFRSVTLFD